MKKILLLLNSLLVVIPITTNVISCNTNDSYSATKVKGIDQLDNLTISSNGATVYAGGNNLYHIKGLSAIQVEGIDPNSIRNKTVISDNGKVVYDYNKTGTYQINNNDATKVSGISDDSYRIVMSDNGSKVYSYGESAYQIVDGSATKIEGASSSYKKFVISSDGSKVYAINGLNIYLIDGTSATKVEGTSDLGFTNIVMSDDGSVVYAASDNALYKIDGTSATKVNGIDETSKLVMSDNGKIVYAVSDNNVYQIIGANANKVITASSTKLTNFKDMDRSVQVIVAPDGSNAYAFNGDIYELNGIQATKVEGIKNAVEFGMSDDGDLVYASIVGETNGFYEIDGAKATKVEGIDNPGDVLVSANGRNVFANSYGSGIYKIDGTSATRVDDIEGSNELVMSHASGVVVYAFNNDTLYKIIKK